MRTTVTVSDDGLVAHVDARDASTDAGRVRRCIERSQELDVCRERVADLEQALADAEEEHAAEIAELESEIERLKREKRLILEQREEHSQLVKAVEREQSLAEERAQAGLATRAKWWLFGRDEEE